MSMETASRARGFADRVLRNASRRSLRERLWTPRLSTSQTTWVVAIAVALLYNGSLWTELFRLRDPRSLGNLPFLASFFIVFVVFTNLLLIPFAFKYVLKPVTMLILLSASVVAYFTHSFGVVMDPTMMQNVFETDPREIRELLTGNLAVYLLVWGLLPVLALWKVRIQYRPFLGELKNKIGMLLLSAVTIGVVAAPLYPSYLSLLHQNREVRHLLAPQSALFSSIKYLRRTLNRGARSVRALGEDARLAPSMTLGGKRRLLILVVGETARAQEFSLNGYVRDTNPWLAREEIVSFDNMLACGTSTAVSLPCMFSILGRRDYSNAEARAQEGLLDVLAHSGVGVVWRDNNSGCKGVCDRIRTEDVTQFRAPQYCDSDECFDEVLLQRLDETLATIDGHAVVVLHQKGSHGPAYYRRHPASFTRFLPECRTNQLQACSRQEIVNAYDNSILYTDYFLDRVIEFLAARRDRYETAMLYVSDHGESLGKSNLYLHGLPYFIAPEEQKRVPFIVWLSDGFRQASGLDWGCLRKSRALPLSHDNLFHSVLGLMNVETEVYDERLDVFAPCRSNGDGSRTLAPLGDAESAGGRAVALETTREPRGRLPSSSRSAAATTPTPATVTGSSR